MLCAEEVAVNFGGVRAVDGVGLEVSADEVVGLVGPNGSGKTTFLNALSGLVPATGRMSVEGRAVPFGRPRQVFRAGVARAFQSPQIFVEGMSCIDNVLLTSADAKAAGLGGATLGRPRMWRHERARWRAAMEAMEFAGLLELAEVPAGSLTYGQQRMLELCRTVAGNPKLLLLDEPSAGLNDAETSALSDLLKSLQTRSIAMLVIDHKVDFIDILCDRVAVLDLGRVIAEGQPHDVWHDPNVMRAYLGVVPDADG
jgi:ABC-type branched-subunit amino acid transport system ATPase component